MEPDRVEPPSFPSTMPPLASAPAPAAAPTPRRGIDGALLATVVFAVAAGVAIALSLGVAIVAAVIPAVMNGIRERDELVAAATGYWPMLFTIVVSQLGMLAVALVAVQFTRAPMRDRLGLVSPPLGALSTAVVVAGGTFPLIVSLVVIGALAPWLPTLDDGQAIVRLWSESTPAEALLWIAMIGLLPGFVEEVLFRGVIQRGYLRRFGPTASILLTSVLFGLLHIAPPAMILAFILGLWLGVVAWRTGSIVPSIATHLCINSGFNAVMVVAHRVEVSESTSTWAGVAIATVSFACFVAAIVILWRMPARRAAISPSAPPTVLPPRSHGAG